MKKRSLLSISLISFAFAIIALPAAALDQVNIGSRVVATAMTVPTIVAKADGKKTKTAAKPAVKVKKAKKTKGKKVVAKTGANKK